MVIVVFVVFVVIGVYNGWKNVGLFVNLLGMIYGKLLFLKFVFVFIVVVFGGYNCFFEMFGFFVVFK